MKVTKWVDMGAEVDIQIGVDDIRVALNEAFAAANQNLEEAVNIHDILRAFSHIGSFLNAFTAEQVALLNSKQREVIHKYLLEAAVKFHA